MSFEVDRLEGFVGALYRYQPTENSFRALETSAKALGISISDLKRAASALKTLENRKSGRVRAMRFAEKAPNLHPDRANVFAFGLLALEKAGYRGLAQELAAHWMHDAIASHIPIAGKYVG